MTDNVTVSRSGDQRSLLRLSTPRPPACNPVQDVFIFKRRIVWISNHVYELCMCQNIDGQTFKEFAGLVPVLIHINPVIKITDEIEKQKFTANVVVGLLGNESPDSNRFTLVTPKPENGVRLQATLGNQNPTGLPVGAVSSRRHLSSCVL